MSDAVSSLFRSRKFLLALVAMIQTLLLHYAGMPMEVWATIDVVIAILIGSIAYEDGMEKSAEFVFFDGDALLED